MELSTPWDIRPVLEIGEKDWGQESRDIDKSHS